MKVDIYKVRRTADPAERRFLFVPVGTDIETLPPERRGDLGDLEIEKTIDIEPGEKRIALNTDEVIRNIEMSGYYVQGVRIETNVSTEAH
ncbi:MAG: YcgL domain-containing protein [Syntrophales bacterium]